MFTTTNRGRLTTIGAQNHRIKIASTTKRILLLFTLLLLLLLFTFYLLLLHPHIINNTNNLELNDSLLLSEHNLLVSLASSSASFKRRFPLIQLSLRSSFARFVVFVDKPLIGEEIGNGIGVRVVVSEDTKRFKYEFPKGLRSAIRVARVVKEAVFLNYPHVHWYVFGDDDTVFFTKNLVRVLGKYDYKGMYYVGSVSESYGQNLKNNFDMAFGGGGFAISSGLATVLAGVLDDCLIRYPHLYGSDLRIYSCVAELGIGLTREPGFHQVDVRGDIFGMLSAHPLSPLLSLHHLEIVDPIFPNMTSIQALEHLFKAVNTDPARILQQTVCYLSNSLTVSVSWGYSVQVFEGVHLLPDLLKMQRTFQPWRRKKEIYTNMYSMNTRELDNDKCKRPVVFFLDSVGSGSAKIWTDYTRHFVGKCSSITDNLQHIIVFSEKQDYGIAEVPRRQCCDVSSSLGQSMVINIRHCRFNELISVRT